VYNKCRLHDLYVQGTLSVTLVQYIIVMIFNSLHCVHACKPTFNINVDIVCKLASDTVCWTSAKILLRFTTNRKTMCPFFFYFLQMTNRFSPLEFNNKFHLYRVKINYGWLEYQILSCHILYYVIIIIIMICAYSCVYLLKIRKIIHFVFRGCRRSDGVLKAFYLHVINFSIFFSLLYYTGTHLLL